MVEPVVVLAQVFAFHPGRVYGHVEVGGDDAFLEGLAVDPFIPSTAGAAVQTTLQVLE